MHDQNVAQSVCFCFGEGRGGGKCYKCESTFNAPATKDPDKWTLHQRRSRQKQSGQAWARHAGGTRTKSATSKASTQRKHSTRRHNGHYEPTPRYKHRPAGTSFEAKASVTAPRIFRALEANTQGAPFAATEVCTSCSVWQFVPLFS